MEVQLWQVLQVQLRLGSCAAVDNLVEVDILSLGVMIISISGGAGSPPEFVLLELQGKLLPAGDDNSGGIGFARRFLGHLKVDDKRLLLQVGGHNIVGSLKDLDRALHVMKQRPGGGGGVAYEVLCVVRRKLVFTERPQPVITAAQGVKGHG